MLRLCAASAFLAFTVQHSFAIQHVELLWSQQQIAADYTKIRTDALENARMEVSVAAEQAAEADAGMAAFLSLPIVLVIAVTAFVVAGYFFPFVPPLVLSLFACAAYVAISVTIDLFIAVQKKNGHSGSAYAFNPVCSIIVSEVVKLLISTIIYLQVWWSSGGPLMPEIFTMADVKWLTLPALIFTINNILVYEAIGKNDMAGFGVFRDTMILWTAVMWRGVFKTPLGNIRCLGIAVIFAGLVINKVFNTIHSNIWTWVFVWVLIMTLCNAAGSVANEFALKRNKNLDINLQNMVLYSACILCSVAFLAATDSTRLGSTSEFFGGFDSRTYTTAGLQAIAGLMVSRLLKYADAVMKTVSTCLRGPCLVLVAPIFVTSPKDAASVISALVVAAGCFTYLTQGPMNSAQAAPAGKAGEPLLPAPQEEVAAAAPAPAKAV